jgi:hypothetical protein
VAPSGWHLVTVEAGQLRMWIARDEDGGVHENDLGDSLFIVACDPYKNDFGQTMVDLLEGGRIFEFIDAEHVDFWSVVVSD